MRTGKIALLLLSAGATLAWAQLYSGSVAGVITDPSSAMVPKAKVALEDPEKGIVLNSETDDSGRFLFRSVPPSTYRLTATAEGFQGQTRTGIRVDVNQNVTVDFSLSLRTRRGGDHDYGRSAAAGDRGCGPGPGD